MTRYSIALMIAALGLGTPDPARAADVVSRSFAQARLDAGVRFTNHTPLTSGVPVNITIPAISSPTVFTGFGIDVPANATRLEILVGGLPSSIPFAIALRRGADIIPSPLTADYPVIVGVNPLVVMTSSSPPLQAGTYYIGIAVVSNSTSASGTLTATFTTGSAPPPAGSTLLTSGVAANFSFGAISSPTVFNGARGWRIDVPAGATRLEVRVLGLPSGAQFAIPVRFGVDVLASPLTADHGTIIGENPVVVTMSSSPALRTGTYYIALVVLTAPGAIAGTITATVTSAAPVAPPVISASRNSLTFTASAGSNPPPQTFTVRNSGGGTLNYRVATNRPWLTAAPAQGSSTGQTQTITVAVNTAGLAVASHTGEVRVTEVGTTAAPPETSHVNPAVIAVQLTVTAAGAVPQIPPGAGVNAASFVENAAGEMILTVYGSNLATGVAEATALPLPTTLAGASVAVRDSAGTSRPASLFFASPGQINLAIPAGTAIGAATLTVTRTDGSSASLALLIERVAPGVFTANADGRGVPAALAIRAAADGTQSLVSVFQCGTAAGSCAPAPISLGPEADQVILLLFGTGLRGASSLAGVVVTMGGDRADALFVGSQGTFIGLDQLNVRIPRSLIGRGEVDLVVSVDGKTANTVRVNIAP